MGAALARRVTATAYCALISLSVSYPSAVLAICAISMMSLAKRTSRHRCIDRVGRGELIFLHMVAQDGRAQRVGTWLVRLLCRHRGSGV